MGKRKTDPGYGQGQVELDLDDDVLLDEDEVTKRLLACFSSPGYAPPRLPSVAVELMSLAQKPGVDLPEIIALLERDTMLVGQVMKLVNSPLYSAQSQVTSLQSALLRIGLNNLRDLVFQASVNLRVFRCDAYADAMERLRRHSTLVGHLCRVVCKYTAVEGEYAFLCGLLHDVGIAATLIALSEGKGKSAPELIAVWPAVDRVHAQAGALIAELWDLPADVRLVIGAHHQVVLQGFPHPLASTVCVANQIAQERGVGLVPGEDEQVKGASALEQACLQSHVNIDASLPGTVLRAREALCLTDAQLDLIGQECSKLTEGLG